MCKTGRLFSISNSLNPCPFWVLWIIYFQTLILWKHLCDALQFCGHLVPGPSAPHTGRCSSAAFCSALGGSWGWWKGNHLPCSHPAVNPLSFCCLFIPAGSRFLPHITKAILECCSFHQCFLFVAHLGSATLLASKSFFFFFFLVLSILLFLFRMRCISQSSEIHFFILHYSPQAQNLMLIALALVLHCA